VNKNFAVSMKIPKEVYKGLRCSHVEIEIDDFCYTSTMRKSFGNTGLRAVHQLQVLYHPERWFEQSLEFDDDIVRKGEELFWILESYCKGYDTTLLGKYITGLNGLDRKDYWICSEIVTCILLYMIRLQCEWGSATPAMLKMRKFIEKDQNPSPLRLALYGDLCGLERRDL